MNAKPEKKNALRRASLLVAGIAVMALTLAAPVQVSAKSVVNWGGCSSCGK